MEFLRAESELWKANFNEARFRRMAGGPGARVRSSEILQQLSEQPDSWLSQLQQLYRATLLPVDLPDLATEAMGIYQGDLYVMLHPADTWTTGRDKDALIEAARANAHNKVDRVPDRQ